MAQITISDLDDRILEQIKARATANGRSLADELRAILSAAAVSALSAPRSLTSFIGTIASRRSQAEIDAYVRGLRDEWEK